MLGEFDLTGAATTTAQPPAKTEPRVISPAEERERNEAILADMRPVSWQWLREFWREGHRAA